jgi:hypothetical protein
MAGTGPTCTVWPGGSRLPQVAEELGRGQGACPCRQSRASRAPIVNHIPSFCKGIINFFAVASGAKTSRPESLDIECKPGQEWLS